MLRSCPSLSCLRRLSLATLPLFGIALLAVHVPRSRAAQPLARPAFVVNSVADATDDDLADPACATSANECTLRAAIQQANALAGPDRISVPPGVYTLTITGTDDLAAAGDLDITDELAISGALSGTTTIDAGARDRIFDVYTTTVKLANLSLQNGYASSDGGGIYNRGTLALTNTTSITNTARSRGGSIYNAAAGNLVVTNSSLGDSRASSGGAIWNSGTLDLKNVRFKKNRASGAGGAVINDGVARVALSTFNGNVAASGGALYQGSSTLTVQRSTVEGNVAGFGGGISVDKGGAVIIEASTVSGNRASLAGGGVYNHGTMQLINSTWISNQTQTPKAAIGSSPAGGGGIWNHGDITALNITLANNAAPVGSAVQSSGTITFTNSIVANNEIETGGENCSGTIMSSGYNLENADTCQFNLPTDLRGVSPKLDELSLNGGTTKTHALMPDSPAIDSGTNVGCPARDQRGMLRPQGPRCDRGAFELEQTSPTATPVTPTAVVVEPPTVTPIPPTVVVETPTFVVTETPTATALPPTSVIVEPPPASPTPQLLDGSSRVLLPMVMK